MARQRIVNDLFGPVPRQYGGAGYAAQPGTGPKGKCCKHCQHYRIDDSYSREYRKCHLTRPIHTKSLATDIKANAPACCRFIEWDQSEE